MCEALNIHIMFDNLNKKFREDQHRIDKEIIEEVTEKRAWVVALLRFINQVYEKLTNHPYWDRVLWCIQLMLSVFASLSIAWSTTVNLAYFGLSGWLFNVCVCAIMAVSVCTMLLSVLQYIVLGHDGEGVLTQQKLRAVDIKLFRSPDMPDASQGKTQAVMNYMKYYALEKAAYNAIKQVRMFNRSIDPQLINSPTMPIELKVHMALVMMGRISSNFDVSQRHICRQIREQYARIYDHISDESLDKQKQNDAFMDKLYDVAHKKSPSEQDVEVLYTALGGKAAEDGPNESEQEQKALGLRAVKTLVMHAVMRFAMFAREHGEELDKALRDEGHVKWMSLTPMDREQQKRLAFRWSVKQHLKRQNKKVSSASVGHFLFMMIRRAFVALSACIPAGFSVLASTPVVALVLLIGGGWQAELCTFFWFCGAANYVLTARKEVEKVWEKLWEYIVKNIIHKEHNSPAIEKHTWHCSVNAIIRAVVSVSQSCATAMFTVVSVDGVINHPGLVGEEIMLHRLFDLGMPWLRPLFMPLCAILSFWSALLHYGNISKYYSESHLPKPKRGRVVEFTATKGQFVVQQLYYLLRHNFDLSKNGWIKIAKLCGSLIAILQTMVLYVSAQVVLGPTLALLIMPGSFLVMSAMNRRMVESCFDLWHIVKNSQSFHVLLDQKYPDWFASPIPSSSVKPEAKKGPESMPRVPLRPTKSMFVLSSGQGLDENQGLDEKERKGIGLSGSLDSLISGDSDTHTDGSTSDDSRSELSSLESSPIGSAEEIESLYSEGAASVSTTPSATPDRERVSKNEVVEIVDNIINNALLGTAKIEALRMPKTQLSTTGTNNGRLFEEGPYGVSGRNDNQSNGSGQGGRPSQ